MSEKFIIPPRTTDGNEIRKFFLNVCQYINGMMETKNSLASVYSGTSQTGLTSGVATKINLDTEIYDIGGNFASYKFTAPVTGYYSAKWSAYMASDGGTLTGGLSYLYKDGASIVYGSYASAINGYMVSSGSKDVYMVAGTYLEVYALGITSSSTWQIRPGFQGTFLTVHLIARS